MAGGTLFDSGMGKLGPGGIQGGGVKFNPDGSTHSSVYGNDGRFSWNTDPLGVAGEPHFTDQGFLKGNPLRHPFGR